MGRLIYAAITSLDGYVADDEGRFDWSAPDEQVHAFVNDLMRPAGTHLYGRRMYEVMRVWETMTGPDLPAAAQDFANLWRDADKVIYSTTLTEPGIARARIERAFDPEAVAALKTTTDRDLLISGPNLAGQALRAGLVDHVHLFLNPVLVGEGNPALPSGVRLDLELVDEHRFASGVIHLHHRLPG